MKNIILKNAAFLISFMLLVSCAGPKYTMIWSSHPDAIADMAGLRNIMLDLPASSKVAIADEEEAVIPEESKKLMKTMLENAGFAVVDAAEADIVINGKTEFAGATGARLVLRAVRKSDGEQISLSRTYGSELFTTDASKSLSILGFADGRDGQTYNINKIGNLAWMSQNLNYNISSSKCFDDDPANCKVYYGRQYNWDDAQNVCPNGWRLPTNNEWKDMVKTAWFRNNERQPFVLDYDIVGARNFWTATEDGKSKAHYFAVNASEWFLRDGQVKDGRIVGSNVDKVSYILPGTKKKTEYLSVRCVREI